MKRYTEDQIDSAIERKDALKAMMRKVESLVDDCIDYDLHTIKSMLEDVMNDLETELDEVDEIVHAGYRQQFDDDMHSYRLAVI